MIKRRKNFEKSIVFLPYCRNNAQPTSGTAGSRQVRWENTTIVCKLTVATENPCVFSLCGSELLPASGQ
jgi:hypothetical protein